MIGFTCAGVSNLVSYKRNIWSNLSCLLETYCHLGIIEKLFVSWQFFKTCDIINYGSGWRKDVINQCLQFVPNSAKFAETEHIMACLTEQLSGPWAQKPVFPVLIVPHSIIHATNIKLAYTKNNSHTSQHCLITPPPPTPPNKHKMAFKVK